MIQVKTKAGVTVTARVIPGPHGEQWEVSDGRKYRALLPTCPCDRKGCESITIGPLGRRLGGHRCKSAGKVCDRGWHEPIVEKFVKAVAKTIKVSR